MINKFSNKYSIVAISTVVFVTLSSALTLEASQDNADINVDVTFSDYIKFTGSAVNAEKHYDTSDVKPEGNNKRGPELLLGTLGIESNSTGLCDFEISTKNNFRLLHTVTNSRLTNYRLKYLGKNITRGGNREMAVPCNSTPSNIQFQAVGTFAEDSGEGSYQDIVMLTVTID